MGATVDGKTHAELTEIVLTRTVPTSKQDRCTCAEAYLDLYSPEGQVLERRRLRPEVDHHDCLYVKLRNSRRPGAGRHA